jgi:hypothetical protein
MRKNIDITDNANEVFRQLAFTQKSNVKNFIERNLEAMGAKGISYLDLWAQCEVLTAKLQELSK